MNTWKKSSETNRAVQIATSSGAVILLIYVTAAFVFANSAYHTSSREGAWGVLSADSGLELLWTLIAIVICVTQWKRANRLFLAVLACNAAISTLLVSQVVAAWTTGS